MEHPLGYLVLAAGVLTFLWAFFRPRRGREPHCRACRFSLAGLTEPAVCPECGRALAKRRAIILGHRPSPKRLVFWSIGLVLAGTALLTLDRMNRTGFFPLTSHKPAWLLHAEAYALGDLRASMATHELAARIADGTLGQAHYGRLVRTSLARHAQTWRAFPDAQWSVITHAMGRGEVPFERVKRVYEDCGGEIVDLVVSYPNGKPYPGETIKVTAHYRWRAGTTTAGARGGNFGFLHAPWCTIEQVTQSGIRTTDRQGQRISIIEARTIPSVWPDISVDYIVPTDLGPGFHSATLVLSLDVDEHSTISHWIGMTQTELEKYASLEKQIEVEFQYEVAALGSHDPSSVNPESFVDDPVSLIQFQIVMIQLPDADDDPSVMFKVGTSSILDPSIGLGGYIVFEQGGREVRTPISYSQPHTTTQQFAHLKGFGTGNVIVRYEHDRDIARSHRGAMTSVLGGPIDLGTITIPEPE